MSCIHYNYRLIEFLFPSIQIIYKFCSSIDKTNLFIMSLSRIIIIYWLFYILHKNGYAKWSEHVPMQMLLYMIFMMYLLGNVLCLILIPFKEVEYDQVQMEEEAEIIAKELDKVKVLKQ